MVHLRPSLSYTCGILMYLKRCWFWHLNAALWCWVFPQINHVSAHLNSSPRRKKLRQALQLAGTIQSTEELTAQEKEVKEPTEIFS